MQEKTLAILKKILEEAGYDEGDFSFDGYAEDAMCFEQVDDTYHVYTGERGRKEDLTIHNDFYEAVNAFLKELCCDDTEADQLFARFKETI